MKESHLVELSKEEASRSNHLALLKKVLKRWVRASFLKILYQIEGAGDFKGEKIGLVERE